MEHRQKIKSNWIIPVEHFSTHCLTWSFASNPFLWEGRIWLKSHQQQFWMLVFAALFLKSKNIDSGKTQNEKIDYKENAAMTKTGQTLKQHKYSGYVHREHSPLSRRHKVPNAKQAPFHMIHILPLCHHSFWVHSQSSFRKKHPHFGVPALRTM